MPQTYQGIQRFIRYQVLDLPRYAMLSEGDTTVFHGIPQTHHGAYGTRYWTYHRISRCTRYLTDSPRNPTVSHQIAIGIPRYPTECQLYPDVCHSIAPTSHGTPRYPTDSPQHPTTSHRLPTLFHEVCCCYFATAATAVVLLLGQRIYCTAIVSKLRFAASSPPVPASQIKH